MSATSIKSHILDNFREMVAASTTFQALVQVTGATTADKIAAAKMFVHEMGATDDDPLPRAIVQHHSYESRIVGTNCRNRFGELYAAFEFVVPENEAEQIATASQWFENISGDICEELMDLARTTRIAPNDSETYMDLRDHKMHESSGIIPSEELPPDESGAGRSQLVWGVSYLFRWQG